MYRYTKFYDQALNSKLFAPRNPGLFETLKTRNPAPFGPFGAG